MKLIKVHQHSQTIHKMVVEDSAVDEELDTLVGSLYLEHLGGSSLNSIRISVEHLFEIKEASSVFAGLN